MSIVEEHPEAARARRAERLRRFWGNLALKFNNRLDETGSLRRDEDPGTFRASGNGINFPTGVLLFLLVQGGGIIWWGAVMTTKMDFLTAQNAELKAKNDVQDLLINKEDNGLDERIRAKTREVLTDWGYIHVPRKGEP